VNAYNATSLEKLPLLTTNVYDITIQFAASMAFDPTANLLWFM